MPRSDGGVRRIRSRLPRRTSPGSPGPPSSCTGAFGPDRLGLTRPRPDAHAGRATAAADRHSRSSSRARATASVRVQVELATDFLRMGLDGVERDEQRLADLTLAEIGPQQAEYGELAIAQLLVVRRPGHRVRP